MKHLFSLCVCMYHCVVLTFVAVLVLRQNTITTYTLQAYFVLDKTLKAFSAI